MQASEVWGVQQGEGAHLDGLWNCLVDERLVESGRDTPAKGSLVAHVVVSFSTAGRPSAERRVLLTCCLSQRTHFPFNFSFQVVGITGVSWGQGPSH